MNQVLPSGTVSLVFSDVEGSTALLSRLGAGYAAALDGQREVLRAAWAAHGGTELGTEGDSFFVVFATAPAAVAAVVAAQRELVTRVWPDGVRVAVRMGVHTGSPTVHDGGYVGMDVHRAARIAGAAHGGQVLLSAATAGLVAGSMPVGVGVRDLGLVQLKDLPAAERVFQVVGPGLGDGFPPVRSLGAVSSLPRPGTELVGRDGELAELTAVLRGSGSGVRLVSLTGPGGSGKTRLAIAVAAGLVGSFPDGVFFVALAAVPSAQVMWTTIAEVLDVPAEGRIPPGFFTHVAHRTALFVLDNLEQVDGADTVVAELLRQAPQAVVITTTRRPLHVAGEHEHPVPPLELPEGDDLGSAARAGAVQLFVQHARMVRPSFALTRENTAEVVGICRGLDGLPLAIELAAARTKLLSPKAVLARLGQALDVKGAGVDRPSRQQTLRATIDWSYQLLTAEQQAFFRRLGIFAGGADLDAITALTADLLDGADPLDLVADLVDASLVRISETPDGEPRITLLETIRAYTRDRLHTTGEYHTSEHDTSEYDTSEYDTTARAHAVYYSAVAEYLRPLVDTDQETAARARYEIEHDNLRQALTYTLTPATTPDPDRIRIGVSLCAVVNKFWHAGGYTSEARHWMEVAVAAAAGQEWPELATCLIGLSDALMLQGDLERAAQTAKTGVDLLRRVNDVERLPEAIGNQAWMESELGHVAAARELYEEALAFPRTAGNQRATMIVLGNFGIFEGIQGEFGRAVSLFEESRDIGASIGETFFCALSGHNIACAMREMGRPEEARAQITALIPQFIESNHVHSLTFLAEDYATILAQLGEHTQAVRLLGATDGAHERIGTQRPPSQQTEIAKLISEARAALTPQAWDTAYRAGLDLTVEDALTITAQEQRPR